MIVMVPLDYNRRLEGIRQSRTTTIQKLTEVHFFNNTPALYEGETRRGGSEHVLIISTY